MKKAKENWIGEQCSEIEESLRKNNSKRAYQLVKDLTTVKQGKSITVQDRPGKCLTEEREILNRWTEYCTELYNHKPNSSVLDCPQTHREDGTPSFAKNGGCSTITEEKEVSWSRQHPSRTGPSGWRVCHHHSHGNLQQDLAHRRMATPWTQSLVTTLPKKGNLQQCQNY